MAFPREDETNELAKQLVTLRDQIAQNNDPFLIKEYKKLQNYCAQKFKYLVTAKVSKYKRFSNHPDLEQEGFEALSFALRTYKPEKGSFTWWASKYIGTKVVRAANAHSTIRIPINKANTIKPFKTSELPTIVDGAACALSQLESSTTNHKVMKAIEQLPEEHKRLISLVYGFNGESPKSIDNVLKAMSISRSQYSKILEEAKSKIKENILSCK